MNGGTPTLEKPVNGEPLVCFLLLSCADASMAATLEPVGVGGGQLVSIFSEVWKENTCR